MLNGYRIGAVIPALNEEAAVGDVVRALSTLTVKANRRLFDTIVVCDNGSTDATADAARSEGAIVVGEQRRGYGFACSAACLAS